MRDGLNALNGRDERDHDSCGEIRSMPENHHVQFADLGLTGGGFGFAVEHEAGVGCGCSELLSRLAVITDG